MSDFKKPDLKNLKFMVVAMLKKLAPYKVIAFIILVAAVYGFVWMQISNLSNAQPSQEAIDSQVKAAQIPHIDQSVVDQLQSLQDNSVSVKTLFNDARSNPFQ